MPKLCHGVYGTHKFYTRGIKLYPEEQLYEEMAFISYYFHWDNDTVMQLDHETRRRWCGEISRINKTVAPHKEKKNIFAP